MKTNCTGMYTGVLALILVLSHASWMEAGESGQLDRIKQALDASSLPQTGQALVNARAADAIDAGVPAEDVEVIVVRALGRNVDGETIIRFLAAGIAAKQDKVPAGAVLDRIEQGLSKGLPPERIAGASERLAKKLAEARPYVDELIRNGVKPGRSNGRDEAIRSAARALEQAIPAEEIERMGAAVKEKGGSLGLFARSLETAASFATRGLAATTASGLVRNAVEKGYSEQDLDGMVKRMDAEMKRGAQAEDAAAKMERDNVRDTWSRERQDIRQNSRTEQSGGAGPGTGGRGR